MTVSRVLPPGPYLLTVKDVERDMIGRLRLTPLMRRVLRDLGWL